MKKEGIIFISLLILSILLVISSASSTGAASAKTAGKVSPAKKTWQQEWDQCLAGAKKEGHVVVASSIGQEVRNALSKAFTGKYGVEVEFIQGKPTELIPKVMAERRAGIFLVDLFVGGPGGIDTSLAPAGVLELIGNELLLPEVLDKKAWWGGELLWFNPDQPYHLVFLAGPRHPITINTNLVKNEEIKSYRDLLNPKWKGKIAWFDPTVAGAGLNAFVGLASLWLDIQFLRDLGKQELIFTRDLRLLSEWVARGKYPISVGAKPELVTEFIQAGAPISSNPVAEGAFTSSAGIALMKNAPNPHAAKLFLNWLLSREGQIIASKAYGYQSAREDVPTDFLGKFEVRKPGVKYLQVERIIEQRGKEYEKVARETWGHLIK